LPKKGEKKLQPTPKPPTSESQASKIDAEPELPQENESEEPQQAPDEPADDPDHIPDPRLTGRPPKQFGDQDQTILDRLFNLPSWEGVWAYVYRHEPFTNRLVGGNRKVHVKRWDTAFDVEDLMREAGSGVYNIQATRLDPKTGKRAMFDSGDIRILNQNNPPLIPMGEWVDDPKNRQWGWAKEAMLKRNAAMIAPPPAAPPPPDPLIEILRDQIRGQNEQLAEMRKEIREANAPKKDPSEQTLLAVLAPIIPTLLQKLLAPPPDPMAALAAAIQLLKQTQPAPTTTPASDPMAILERHIALTAKLDEMAPNKPSAQRSRMEGWQEFTTGITHELAPVIAPIMQVVAMTIAEKQREAREKAARENGQQPQPVTHRQPAPPPTPALPPSESQVIASTGPQLVKQPTIEALAQGILDHLAKAHSGLDLGDWYIDEYGMQEFTDLRLAGKSQLMADLATVPAVWASLLSYQQTGDLDKMLDDFLTWEPAEEEEEEEQPGFPGALYSNGPTPPLAAIKEGWTPSAQEAK
jgi:hypothetical protein